MLDLKEIEELMIELIDLLFQLDEDKNYSLSDLERYKYGKILEDLKKSELVGLAKDSFNDFMSNPKNKKLMDSLSKK